MFTYFKMKRYEWKVKAEIYKFIFQFVNNSETYIDTAMKLVDSLRGVSLEDMQGELISKLAEIVHNDTERDG